jgi:hypothetical protein
MLKTICEGGYLNQSDACALGQTADRLNLYAITLARRDGTEGDVGFGWVQAKG